MGPTKCIYHVHGVNNLACRGRRQATQGNANGGGWSAPEPLVLRGHAGPVYATSCSPDYKNVLSASEDCTVRLWNLSLRGSNLACYRGHKFPICQLGSSCAQQLTTCTVSYDRRWVSVFLQGMYRMHGLVHISQQLPMTAQQGSLFIPAQ